MHRTFNYFYLVLGLILAVAALLWKLWVLLLLALPAIGLFFYRRRSR
jgi:hypothetical protein